jgi:hypothetical protein
MLEETLSKLSMPPGNFFHRGNDFGSRFCEAYAFAGIKKPGKRSEGNRTKKERLLDYLLFSVLVQGRVLLNGASVLVLLEG